MIAAIYVLLIFMLLIVVPRDAEAECAWMLWSRVDALDWSILSAYGSEAACDRACHATPDNARGKNFTVIGGAVLLPPGNDGKRIVITYVCAPDTIDPRGPKR